MIYLPYKLDEHLGRNVYSHGRSDLPACLAVWSMGSEKRLLESLVKELNQELLTGPDTSPNFSRSGSRPDLYPAFRAGGIQAAAYIDNSNAKKMAAAAGTN